MAPDEIRTRAFSIATQRKVFSRDRVCEEIEKLVAEASRSDEATPMKSPDRDAADELAKPCTCHPDDNPPVPCAQKYALTDCKASELATLRRRVDALECALRPFAQYAEGFGPHAREDGWVIATRPSGTKPLTMGHVREALLVLSPPTRKE